jgi:Glucose-6-phosphate dehydrogenase, NAD binding domain
MSATQTAPAKLSSGMRTPGDHVIVLFGATGDLARRKLLPGLYHLDVPDFCRSATGSSAPPGDRCRTRPSVQSRARRSWSSVAASSILGPGTPSPRGSATRRPTPLTRPRSRMRSIARRSRSAARPGCCTTSRCRRSPSPASLRRSARAVSQATGGSSWKAVRHRPRLGSRAQRDRPRRLRQVADLPDRPLPRQGNRAEHPRAALLERNVRARLEPRAHRPRPDRRAGDALDRQPCRQESYPSAGPLSVWPRSPVDCHCCSEGSAMSRPGVRRSRACSLYPARQPVS